MRCWSLCLIIWVLPGVALATGARLYKSGPIQITADGSTVWSSNPDHDSVSRLDTVTEQLLEIPLPAVGHRHRPRGLALRDDGSEVWVACQDSDRIYVLRGSDGAQLARIDLPWGAGPYSVVLSPPAAGGVQRYALVTGFRGASLFWIDAVNRSILATAPVFRSPLGSVFAADGSVWVTHFFADGEHPRLTRLDVSNPGDPRVTANNRVFPAQPQNSQATFPRPAEGGYLTLRGHPAQVPSGHDQGRIWLPVQYQNIHDHAPSPSSVVQSTIRKLDPASWVLADGTNHPGHSAYPAKIILSAVEIHDPVTPGPIYDGPGWNAAVSGAVDVAFSADGLVAYVLHEQSEDILVVPTDTPPIKPVGAPPLIEIAVGKRPMGLVASPTTNRAYVANVLSRSISVVDLSSHAELRQIAATPSTGEPFGGAKLRGARIFHSANEDAISRSRKVACASCHLNGEHDGRIWDLQHLPGQHGPRHTQSLAGLGLTFGPADPATGWGQLHRSGDRDEVQDFEHTFQGPQMGGDGFLGATVHSELGTPNAGRNADLDALATYVLGLPAVPRSPHRQAGGALSTAAVRGATFFRGSDPARPADAMCATCHVPASGFVDRKFHDVGQGNLPGENELDQRSPADHVNTATLVGLWTTGPYEGTVGFTETLAQALFDFRDRPPEVPAHGRLGGLTRRQMRDLAEFLLSIDGNTTAAEVMSAQDLSPPSIARVSPTATNRLEVWFDESVTRASVESLSAWQLTDLASGQNVPITSAAYDPQNGDRVTLIFDPPSTACGLQSFELQALGPIHDLAASASGGTTNALIDGPPIAFSIGDTLSITLGASGYENLTVETHDAGTLPGLTSWSHGSVWLFPNQGDPATGLVRFDWSQAFRAATGVVAAAAIRAASIELRPTWGSVQTIEARRVLQAWYDHHQSDWTSNPIDPASGHGGPTWDHSEHGVRAWNQSNAGATVAGLDGDQVGDYFGAADLAAIADATLTMTALEEPFVLTGPRLVEAFRFWLDHPNVDFGHALRVLPSSEHEIRFESSEHDFQDRGPVLRLTYAPDLSCLQIFADDFESGGLSAWSSSQGQL